MATRFREADDYWAHQRVSREALQHDGILIVEHGAELADYDGVFAYFHRDSIIVSVPRERAATLRPEVERLGSSFSPREFAEAMRRADRTLIGPASIFYTTTVSREPTARLLAPEDGPSLAALQAACSPTEWEHGGPSPRAVAAGVFARGELAAVASYEVWGGALAHISVVTHPERRGRGFGRAAVADVAVHALNRGLLLQYRTLAANHASLRLAAALGFQPYAQTVAVRLQK